MGCLRRTFILNATSEKFLDIHFTRPSTITPPRIPPSAPTRGYAEDTQLILVPLNSHLRRRRDLPIIPILIMFNDMLLRTLPFHLLTPPTVNIRSPTPRHIAMWMPRCSLPLVYWFEFMSVGRCGRSLVRERASTVAHILASTSGVVVVKSVARVGLAMDVL